MSKGRLLILLRYIVVVVAFLYILQCHVRLLLFTTPDPSERLAVPETIKQSSPDNVTSSHLSSLLTMETHEIINDAPFTFAACLLVMDDNKILPEWLAYHYQVLPLRRLILATDPYSTTSSKPILDAYQQHLGLNVTLWTDADYHYNRTEKIANFSWDVVVQHPQATPRQRNAGFLWRQLVFYTECARQLKREGQSEWVIIIDSDEYMSYNFYNDTSGSETNPPQKVCKRVNVSSVQCRNDGLPVNMMKHFGLQFPRTIVGNGGGDGDTPTIAHYMHKYWNDTVLQSREKSDVCDVLPRTQIGARDEPPPTSAAWWTDLPPAFDFREFRTLSYREHNQIRSIIPGKAMLNLKNWGGRNMLSIHRGTGYCFNAKLRNRPEPSLSFFRLNHYYTGSLSEFLSRPGDARRTLQTFQSRNDNAGNVTGNTNAVTPWLASFVKQVGPRRAFYLTQGLRQWAMENDDGGSSKAEQPQ